MLEQVLFTPWPWAALGVGLPKELIAEQREINRIEMGTLEIFHDRYMMPKTSRVQFRFPRSKKRRICNKWAKQPRNFRYESVAWLVDKSKLMKLEYPRAKPLPLPPFL